MTIRAYELQLPWENSANHGIAIVDSVTDAPLAIGVYMFKSLDDFGAFMGWLLRVGLDPRRMTHSQILGRAEEWATYAREAAAADRSVKVSP